MFEECWVQGIGFEFVGFQDEELALVEDVFQLFVGQQWWVKGCVLPEDLMDFLLEFLFLGGAGEQFIIQVALL